MNHRLIAGILLTFSIFTLFACGGGGAKAPQKQTITFSESGTIALFVGDVRTTHAASSSGTPVQIVSSNPDILAIDANGTLTALQEGQATLTLSADANAQYQSAQLTLNVSITKQSQQISVDLNGALKGVVGQSMKPDIQPGPGAGAIHFSTTNSQIAAVDAEGNVTLLAPGNATINIHQDADTRYLSASAQFDVNVVTQQFQFSAWLGEESTEVTISSGTDGIEFYRSTDSECDLQNYASCAEGQLDILAGMPVTDSAALLSQVGYYTFQHGSLKAQQTLSNEKFTRRGRHQVLTFKNRLWVIGGLSAANNMEEYSNEVWSSADGVTWELVAPEAEFSPRDSHQVVAFNDRLWLFGGENETDEFLDVWSSADGIHWNAEGTISEFDHVTTFDNKILMFFRSGEIRSSTDGVHWVVETAEAEFGHRTRYPLISFNERLWLIDREIWSSADGINWQLENADSDLPIYYDNSLTVLDNQIWLIARVPFNNHLTQVLHSTDGIHWSQLTSHAELGTRGYKKLLALNNQLYVFAGNWNNRVWSSHDGISWEELTITTKITHRSNHQMVTYNGRLWIFGGTNGGVSNNEIWSSTDGIRWTQEITDAAFSARRYHQVLAFNGRLWLFGGWHKGPLRDIWSSVDGIHWVLEAEEASFGERAEFGAIVFNDKMWVIGGRDPSNFYGKNDVWSSTDGINWQLEKEHADFDPRHSVKLTVFQEKLWMVGGHGVGSQNRSVWSSSDGVQWTHHPAPEELDGRVNQAILTFQDRIWLLGGYYAESGDSARHIWSSTDGLNWTHHDINPLLESRSGHQMTVWNDQIWLSGGHTDYTTAGNQVWRSPDGFNWFLGVGPFEMSLE